jgi:hypothetical protein
MLNKIYQIIKLIAVFCFIPITIYLCIFLHSLTLTTYATKYTIENFPTKIELHKEVADLKTDVLSRVDTLIVKADTQVTTITTKTNDRVAKIQTDLNTQLGTFNTNVNNQLTTANNSISALSMAYAEVPKDVGSWYKKDFAPYTNCQTNKLCIQGQFSDTLFAIRTTSRDTSDTMTSVKTTLPQLEAHLLSISNTFAVDVPKITTSIAGLTENINVLTKPKWYDRILGYAMNGVIMYRNLNPITNVSIEGVRLGTTQSLSLVKKSPTSVQK